MIAVKLGPKIKKSYHPTKGPMLKPIKVNVRVQPHVYCLIPSIQKIAKYDKQQKNFYQSLRAKGSKPFGGQVKSFMELYRIHGNGSKLNPGTLVNIKNAFGTSVVGFFP